ncbi:Brr6p [Sugiyamaella lignohabitans]|uniref:Brr6p n=1 Tax=Sugiyamaella lignohabitans TaxID=796027 RepID=A0A161HHA2_9ASCO|nr:Brr6p [Sugiyamaella lignohabitans]ANB11477.1 Brr6p [Sugiyamaella lignohabitans]
MAEAHESYEFRETSSCPSINIGTGSERSGMELESSFGTIYTDVTDGQDDDQSVIRNINSSVDYSRGSQWVENRNQMKNENRNPTKNENSRSGIINKNASYSDYNGSSRAVTQYDTDSNIGDMKSSSLSQLLKGDVSWSPLRSETGLSYVQETSTPVSEKSIQSTLNDPILQQSTPEHKYGSPVTGSKSPRRVLKSVSPNIVARRAIHRTKPVVRHSPHHLRSRNSISRFHRSFEVEGPVIVSPRHTVNIVREASQCSLSREQIHYLRTRQQQQQQKNESQNPISINRSQTPSSSIADSSSTSFTGFVKRRPRVDSSLHSSPPVPNYANLLLRNRPHLSNTSGDISNSDGSFQSHFYSHSSSFNQQQHQSYQSYQSYQSRQQYQQYQQYQPYQSHDSYQQYQSHQSYQPRNSTHQNYPTEASDNYSQYDDSSILTDSSYYTPSYDQTDSMMSQQESYYSQPQPQPQSQPSDSNNWQEAPPLFMNPDLPSILSSYLQLSFNFGMMSLLIYSIWIFLITVQHDVENKIQEYSADILAEIAQCSKEYIGNNCMPHKRVPALETTCNNWEKCMNQDPMLIGRARVSAETFGEIINSFLNPIGLRSMCFLILAFIGSFILVNLSLSHHPHSARTPKTKRPRRKPPAQPVVIFTTPRTSR